MGVWCKQEALRLACALLTCTHLPSLAQWEWLWELLCGLIHMVATTTVSDSLSEVLCEWLSVCMDTVSTALLSHDQLTSYTQCMVSVLTDILTMTHLPECRVLRKMLCDTAAYCCVIIEDDIVSSRLCDLFIGWLATDLDLQVVFTLKFLCNNLQNGDYMHCDILVLSQAYSSLRYQCQVIRGVLTK